MRCTMNLIGLFSLAWVFLSCNQEEGKENRKEYIQCISAKRL